jgi:hypothetical protein
MSYATARSRLVQILSQEVTPSDQRLYSDRALVHLPTGRAGARCPSRSFWLEANVDGEGGVTGPFTPDLQGQPRQTYAMTLTVSYQLHENRAVMDEVMASDLREYSIALLTPGYWQSSTSGILSVTSGPLFLPTRRVLLDGSMEQRTSFNLLFR